MAEKQEPRVAGVDKAQSAAASEKHGVAHEVGRHKFGEAVKAGEEPSKSKKEK